MRLKTLFSLCLLTVICHIPVEVAAQKTSYSAWNAFTAPAVDGIGNDECWKFGDWGSIDEQWFSNRPIPDSMDFHGRYKVVWTSGKLFLLLEITDDVLNDDIKDPLNNYWEDDCLEVFLDEDKSGGDHKCCTHAYNAFAYHISPVTQDAVDLSDDGDFVPKLFNNHVSMAVSSTGSLHTLEFAISIYDHTFSEDHANTPVTLTSGKLMGFSIAYCDDDGRGREDFMATQKGGLDSWMNADLFGELVLLSSVTSASIEGMPDIRVYPNPGEGILHLQDLPGGAKFFRLFNSVGIQVQSGYTENSSGNDSIVLKELPFGVYYLCLVQEGHKFISKVMLSSR
jgi:hypothetical protein